MKNLSQVCLSKLLKLVWAKIYFKYFSCLEFSEPWESKLRRAESIRQQREAVFAEMGVAIKEASIMIQAAQVLASNISCLIKRYFQIVP